MQRGFNERVIHADRADLDAESFDAKFLNQFLLHRMPRLGAESAHAFVRVIAGKRGQVHACDRAQKPCRLPFLLHRAACHLRLGAALHRTGVHANFLHPIQVERDAAIGQQWSTVKRGQRLPGASVEP